ncbi:hypothetical protein DL1_08480 [Thioclava dalianensis]|uniref:Phage protein n=1 Tax=Thioclava dalianensis TaxID=1185766 RepID=A0A074TIJ5_9RHOB|nr:DUF6682 family protein [Thioclava dalianensis]KEP68813.1 hypothetical protein DL1_08480 [Thioclava dalianensis]SFN50204.1 hypothetical protein SAMN05216224_10691 [Thioclava dalianensis]
MQSKDILKRARAILSDAGNVRWTVTELNDCLNDTMQEIALHRPSAFAETRVIPLAEGTYQEIPEDFSLLLRAVRNITSDVDAKPRVSGPIVTPIEREILDSQMANWHDTNSVPFNQVVTHIVFEELAPRSFYVFPGNDGTGKMEVLGAVEPEKLPVGSNALDIETYDATIPLSTVYQSVLIDGVLYYAYSKDMNMAGSAQRAVAHYQKFLGALGVRTGLTNTQNPNTTEMQPGVPQKG